MSDVPEGLAAALADRYRMERELGAGGMATVYLAEDLRHQRQVAIKVLKPELAAVLGADRFVQEITTTAQLQHPHILPLFDSGTADGFLFYVMPYVEGETLRDKLNRETQLGVDEAVRITREVADALDYAHRHGVIHRDIKPENILLHDGRPMVADFGIALAVSAAAGGRMTETGLSLGTPHYMSPEQATGERDLTGRSDVYSLASVLYEMLTGDPPHVGSSAQQIIMKIVTEEAAPVTKLRKSVPPNVAAAVAKALEKLPADRFESAKAFAEALVNPAYGIGLQGAGTAPGSSRQRPARWAMAAAAAVAVLAGAVGGVMLGRRGLVRPLVSRQRIELWQQPPEADAVGRGLAISPDGNVIVFRDSVGGSWQLWSKERDRLEATVLTGTTGARAPVFSPDGQWVAFVADGKLKKVPRLGGSAVIIADSANEALPAIAWLDNGTIAFNNAAYGLVLVGEDGGAVRRLIGTDSLKGGVVTATPFPGGTAVLLGLCGAGCSTSRVAALDVRGAAAPKELADDALKAWAAPGGAVVFIRRDGGVFVGAFDGDRLAFTGAPVPVLDGVQVDARGADMALGRNGTLIYETGAPQGAVQPVWVSRQGTVSPVDSGWSFSPGGRGSFAPGPALSPDGRRVAVSVQSGSSEDIWIKELGGGRQFTRLTFGAGLKFRPAWTADGRSVVYIIRPPDGETSLIASRLADGRGGEVTLFKTRNLSEVQPARDTARLIVRTGSVHRAIQLYTLGADSLVPLLADPNYNDMGPALSPDGRWLAYTSDETGRSEVYVRPFPKVRDGRWPVSANGGSEPKWSHSGRELFYRAADGGFIATELKPGPTFASATQERLFDASEFQSSSKHHAYAVAPGDDRFLFFRQQSGSASLVMVEHWFEELKAREQGKNP